MTAGYRIRDASAADQSFLWDMLYAAIYVPAGGQPFPRPLIYDQPLCRYAAGFGLLVGDCGLIAETSSGEAVGAAWVRLFAVDAPGFGFVDDETPELSIAIAEPHRGLGLGTLLLDALLVRVQERGWTGVSLSCDPANPAWRLYKRAGFHAWNSSEHPTMLRRVGGPRLAPGV